MSSVQTTSHELPISSHDAAKESNLPSRGLPGPASFEDWMGHQARAAPGLMLRRTGLQPGPAPWRFLNHGRRNPQSGPGPEKAIGPDLEGHNRVKLAPEVAASGQVLLDNLAQGSGLKQPAACTLCDQSLGISGDR